MYQIGAALKNVVFGAMTIKGGNRPVAVSQEVDVPPSFSFGGCCEEGTNFHDQVSGTEAEDVMGISPS